MATPKSIVPPRTATDDVQVTMTRGDAQLGALKLRTLVQQIEMPADAVALLTRLAFALTKAGES